MHRSKPNDKRLTVFCRVPQPGRSKTRLIPAVGAKRAATLHREMALRTLTTAEAAQCAVPGLAVRISVAGPQDAAPAAFGSALPFEEQPGGDLGERMATTFRVGWDDGGRHQVIIGTDAPGLSPALIEQAFESLRSHDLVLGPARDGGYYLIGLSMPPPPSLFQSIPWGGPEVLGLTLSRASEAGLKLQLLPALDDVDEPSDLRHWYRVRRRWPATTEGSGVSVVIPVRNEADRIGHQVRQLIGSEADEVIVVDGGSDDGSVQQAEEAGARVVTGEPGRADQMNQGARLAKGPILLFLHADTRLAPGWREEMLARLADSRTVGGSFRFRLDQRRKRYRLLEWLVAMRTRWLRRPYGDQGLFCRREAFFRLNGFPDVPVMEDFVFVGRLRKEGRLARCRTTAISSARNWERVGFWRVVLAHRLVILGYYLGIPLPRLARLRRRLLNRQENRGTTEDTERR